MIKCLYCGSANVDFYRKISLTKVYKVNKNNMITKRTTDNIESVDGEYCSCLDCDEIFGVNLSELYNGKLKIENIYELDAATIQSRY